MTANPKDQQKQRRAQRLSVALRDNLKRRKAQARGRHVGDKADSGADRGPAGASPATHDSAGFGGNKRNG